MVDGFKPPMYNVQIMLQLHYSLKLNCHFLNGLQYLASFIGLPYRWKFWKGFKIYSF